jgi:peptidyl-prolyl cis-trans isomerase B (cyclophilin B)
MANPARPNANGSQFFLVYQDTQLGPNYTIWGKITKGLDTIKKIGEIGALQWQGNQAIYAPDGDGEPIQQVAIIKATAK